jgi:predicted negative regulator of RcsB-dependent stress response
VVEKKITRKELLKEPDEFLTTTGQVVRYVQENPRLVTIGVALVVIAALIAFGVNSYVHHRQVRSQELFEAVQRDYEVAARSSTPATPENLDKLLARFEEIAKDYPSLPAGEMAVLYSGHVLYKKGSYQAALDQYTKMQSSNLVKEGLGPLVLYHMATTRLALKDYDQALTLFDQLSKDINSPYRREAHASIARIYEMMGKNKEAVQAYRQYLKMFPEAPDAAFIKTRIADLSVVG